MSENPLLAREAFSRLVCALVDERAALTVTPQELPARVNWLIDGVSVDDFGKVLGRRGAHFQALRVVAARIGDRLEEMWTVPPMPDPPARRRETPADVPPNPAHSPAADLLLLQDVVLAAVGPGCTVGVVKAGSADWRFTLFPQTYGEHEALVEKGGLPPGEPLVAALGTLMRAVGRRQGAGYVVEIAGG